VNDINVIAISHGFQPNYEVGFVNGLAEAGVRVCLIGSDATLVDELDPRVQMLNLRGSQRPDRSSLAKALNMMRYHWRLLAFVRKQPQAVVHVIGLFRAPFWMGVVENWMLKRWSSRLLVTVHNVLPHNRHTVWNRWIYWLVFRVPQVLVVHTSRMRDEIERDFGIASARITVMEHGIRALQAPDCTARRVKRSELGLHEDNICVLFFGAISPYKGLDTLLKAFELAPTQHVLLIAGRFPSDESAYRNAILDAIARHPRSADIRLHEGYVAEAEVPRYYAAADVAVLPYRHIDQSGVLLQALGYGVPVLAFSVGSFQNYLHGERGRLCTAPTSHALAAALSEIASPLEPSKRERIAMSASEYLWRNTVASILPAYERN